MSASAVVSWVPARVARSAVLPAVAMGRRSALPLAMRWGHCRRRDDTPAGLAIDAAQRPGGRSSRGSDPWLNRFQVNELSRTNRPGSDLIKVYCAAAFRVVANRPRVGRGHRHP